MIKEVTFYYPKDTVRTKELYEFSANVDFDYLLTYKYTKDIIREFKDYKTGKFVVRVKINWINSKKFDKFIEKGYSKNRIVYTIKNIYGGNI